MPTAPAAVDQPKHPLHALTTFELRLLPTAAVIGTVALGLSARIAARFGPRAMLLAGPALITAGLASGLFDTTQQIGAAVGVAALSTLAAAQTRSAHPGGVAGYHLAFAAGAGLAGAAVIVAAVVLRPSRRRAALAECC
jgi:MFS family permease